MNKESLLIFTAALHSIYVYEINKQNIKCSSVLLRTTKRSLGNHLIYYSYKLRRIATLSRHFIVSLISYLYFKIQIRCMLYEKKRIYFSVESSIISMSMSITF